MNFTVDAALLRELGERLVGKPHIALAELIKNAYDADARHVRIAFTGSTIVVEDDGHGMSAQTFESYWMSVGTTHKAQEKKSPELARPLTGSKGVGRLAAQLLASELEIESVALANPALAGHRARREAPSNQRRPKLTAEIDWHKARGEGQLTEVEVPIIEGGRSPEAFAGVSVVGTRLTLSDLTSGWGEEEFKDLAREIWALQPPFDVDEDDEQAFEVELVSEFEDVVAEFNEQMFKIFDNWQGKVSMVLEDDDPERDVLFEFDPLKDWDRDEDDQDDTDEGEARAGTREVGITKMLRLTVDLRSGGSTLQDVNIRILDCPIDRLESDIRVFNLAHRQPHGISVGDAREYMRAFGGVHIYDDRFRLPYYGPEDWLHIERDHARRLSRSQLLPQSLRVSKGLHDLPSRRRIFGTTIVSTAHEQQTADDRHLRETEALSIQINRDRLADNLAFNGLRAIVRLGLDLYATEVARAKAIGTGRRRKDPAPPRRPTGDIKAALEVLRDAQDDLEPEQYESITDYLHDADQNSRDLEARADSQAALFGTLATVGMTTLAWEHEAAKQRLVVHDAAEALNHALTGDTRTLRTIVATQADRLEEAAQRLSDVARLFRPVLDRESRETKTSLKAQRFLQRTVNQIGILARGATVTVGSVPKDLRLPPGTHAGWVAIVQNLLVNAFNAVLDQPRTEVLVDAGTDDRVGWVRIQDTGVGVDLATAEEFFLPFVRGMKDDARRAALGLGGSGLGLTIVRMIGDSIGVTVRFVEPDATYATAIRIEWKIDD